MKADREDTEFSIFSGHLSKLRSFFSQYLQHKDESDDSASSPYSYLFGDALLKENLITEDHLKHALYEQSQKLKNEGKVVRLGEMIVSLGYAREEQILQTINRHYRISAKSLSDNIEEMIVKSRLSSKGGMSFLHPPIMIKLVITFLFIMGLTVLTLGYFILDREKEKLYRQTIELGKVSLTYFTNSAKVPLISDDILRLNTLIKESASVGGIVYTCIVDTKGMIKAHTDLNKIGTSYLSMSDTSAISNEGEFRYYDYSDSTGSKFLNLSRPVMFQNKLLGEVNLGVSLDFIEQQIKKEKLFIIIVSIVIVTLGIILAILLGFNFSRPIAKLAAATQEIGKGNFNYYVNMPRKDEFGNLAMAFNYMSYELKMKSRLQETFGRYVSPAILKIIMADPEKTWLKGTRTNASILFTDIRGFTAYSEKTEPETIVEQLNEYFSIATKFILKNGGYVDKFIGDAVLGVFGAPIPHAHHAEMAVRTAVEMQQELQKISISGNDILSKIGMGINSGVVLSGNLGSQVRMEYSIIGDSVNVAAHLNAMAGPGEIIISRSVYDVIQHIVTVEALPSQQMKGKTESIESFRVINILPRAL